METIIAIDAGKLFTGIVVANIDVENLDKQMEIVMMKVIEAADYKSMQETLSTFIEKRLFRFGPSKVLIERLFHVANKKTYMYRNWPLLKMHKHIRTFFEDKGFKVMSLYPSQKFRVSSGTHKKRKLCSVDTAKMLLEKNDFLWTKIFHDYKRNHDIADCLLMIEYLRLRRGKPTTKRDATAPFTE